MAGNANFPLWTDLIFSDQSLGTQSITNAGRTYSNTAGGAEIFGYVDTRIPESGKYYWEIYVNTRGSSTASIGISSEDQYINNYSTHKDFFGYTGPGSHDNEKPIYQNNGRILYGDTSTLTGLATWTTGDIISVAVDCDNNKVFWAKNNSWVNSADPSTGTTGGIAFQYDPAEGFTNLPAIVHYQSGKYTCNFGQDSSFCGAKSTGSANSADGNGYGDFYYAPPTNYLALCSANTPTGTGVDVAEDEDKQSLKLCNTGIYTGTGTARSITGVGFQPDFVILSQRSTGTTANNYVFDSSRGVEKYLTTNEFAAQSTDSNSLTAFGTDGFSLGTSGAGNASTQTYLYSAWKCNGGTTSTNTQGTITTTVQVNDEAGFSIITYAGNSTSGATIGHGLSKKPNMFWIKCTNNGEYWANYNYTMTANKYLMLSENNVVGDATDRFNDTEPTATVITLGSSGNTNETGRNYVCYAWHHVGGFFHSGVFKGNANADGAFCPLDFTPQVLILKQMGGADDWGMYTNPNQDNPGINPLELVQRLESTNGEQGSTGGREIDFLARGFKLRTSNSTFNESDHYFYAAWGRLPAKFPNAFGGDFG